MNQQIEHRGVIFQFTQEFEQDLLAVFGTSAQALATATIDHLLDSGETPRAVTIHAEKTPTGLQITCAAQETKGVADNTSENLQ